MLSNKGEDLSPISIIDQSIKNDGKKTNRRYCQYSPTWFKSQQESMKGISKSIFRIPRKEVLDLNSKELLDLKRVEACSNINETARKEIDSLKRKLTEYFDEFDEFRICESDKIDLCPKISDSQEASSQNEQCSSTVVHINGGTCQTLREFLKSKKYRLRYGIPIPYSKLFVSLDNCQKDEILLNKTRKYLNLMIFHINRIEFSKMKSVIPETQKLKLRGGGNKKQNEPKKLFQVLKLSIMH